MLHYSVLVHIKPMADYSLQDPPSLQYTGMGIILSDC